MAVAPSPTPGDHDIPASSPTAGGTEDKEACGREATAMDTDQQVRQLMEEKRTLEEKLKEKEDKLHKLKMVKLYRSKVRIVNL